MKRKKRCFILPFLQNSQEASASGPVKPVKREPDEEGEDMDLLGAAGQEVLNAIKANNPYAFTEALKSFCHIVDALPHLEAEHK